MEVEYGEMLMERWEPDAAADAEAMRPEEEPPELGTLKFPLARNADVGSCCIGLCNKNFSIR